MKLENISISRDVWHRELLPSCKKLGIFLVVHLRIVARCIHESSIGEHLIPYWKKFNMKAPQLNKPLLTDMAKKKVSVFK